MKKLFFILLLSSVGAHAQTAVDFGQTWFNGNSAILRCQSEDGKIQIGAQLYVRSSDRHVEGSGILKVNGIEGRIELKGSILNKKPLPLANNIAHLFARTGSGLLLLEFPLDGYLNTDIASNHRYGVAISLSYVPKKMDKVSYSETVPSQLEVIIAESVDMPGAIFKIIDCK